MQIGVESRDGGAEPSVIEAWVADAYLIVMGGTTASQTPGQPGVFRAADAVPRSLPNGAAVWIRLTFPDGSVLEAGHDGDADFSLR